MPERIRQGLEQGEFYLVYQPIYDTSSNRIIGLEALLRWAKDGIVLSPDSFVGALMREVIYNPDTVGALYMKVFDDAIKSMCGLCPDVYLSINVSIDQLTDMNHAQMLLHILSVANRCNRKLVFEILETEALTDSEWTETNKIFKLLQSEGATFAIDDFGAGSSNILRLLTLPITIVKIDKSVIDTLYIDGTLDSRRALYLNAIVDMFLACGVEHIVAEGVENKVTSDILSRIGMDYQQGFYFLKPIPYEGLSSICDR